MDRSRLAAVLALLLLPLGALEARLLHLQILQEPGPAGEIRQSVHVSRAMRGRLLDARGRVLAEDVRSFDAYIVLEEFERAPWAVADLLGLPPEELRQDIDRVYERIERQIKRRPPAEHRILIRRELRTPYLLARNIPFEAALRIETAPQAHPGLVIRESLRRRYPFGPLAAHLTGYLGRITANEEEYRDYLQSNKLQDGMEEHIGQDGIAKLFRRGVFQDEMIGRQGGERSFDEDLRGKLGLYVLERQAGSGAQEISELLPATPGRDVELTADLDLQRHADAVLAGPHHASAVVLDVRTGAVLLLASNRTYDPNAFIPPGQASELRRWFGDTDGRPMQSRAFAQHFQIGSVFKVVSSVAALEEKLLQPGEMLPCRGKFDESVRSLNCWIWNEFRGMHGEVSLRQALEQSCNCFYYELGRRLDMEPLLRWARAFGFGDRTGLDLPYEVPGRLPQRRHTRNDPLMLSIGQGDFMATPIQAAVLMAALANGGTRVVPHLRRDAAPRGQSIPISAATLQAVRQGLYDVTHGSRGTSRNTRLRDFKAVGKTGSAQAGAGRESHAWFAGYAPYDEPEVAVAVFVANAGHGGDTAAPLAARLLEKVFEKR